MDDPAAARASMNSLKRQNEEEKRHKAAVKEICDGMISGAMSPLSKAKEKNGG
jgi:hypothetical protein